jgi:hypothetical protein
MKRFSFIFLFIVSLLDCSVVYAAEQTCDESTLGIVAKHLKLKDIYLYDYQTEKGSIVSAACKVAPQDKNIELVAIAYESEESMTKSAKADLDATPEKNVIVVMIDLGSKRIVGKYQSIITEDAAVQVGDNSFLLDTAAYQLAPKVRAFGLRFQNAARGPSCAQGWQSDELQLFVQEGAKLKSIFVMPMENAELLKGDCLNDMGGEKTILEEAKLTIKVQKTVTNGFADLMLNAAITTDGTDLKAKKIKSRVEQHLMQYDGKKYFTNMKKAPWWIGSAWALQ